jgi:hypothetical protein
VKTVNLTYEQHIVAKKESVEHFLAFLFDGKVISPFFFYFSNTHKCNFWGWVCLHSHQKHLTKSVDEFASIEKYI